MSKGGAITQKGPGHSSDKKAQKEQQMRAREKLLINNGGTVVLGSHSMPHAAMGPLQQNKMMTNGGQIPTIVNGLSGIPGSATNGIAHQNGMIMNGTNVGEQTSAGVLKNGSLASTAASTGNKIQRANTNSIGKY